MSVLQEIYSGKSIKQLNINELKTLSDEIRTEIISTTATNGGHLSSNLGSVELTIALMYVFDFPSDKVIFDVGHQSYAYKILTDRFDRFSTIRKEGGLSGFPDPEESEYDAFSVGHAGTSISAGLGYCYSRDFKGENNYIIDVVGDASFFNGENLEAITATKTKPNNFLVILNDNGMSINKNDNGLYKVISKITVKKSYNRFNSFLSRTIGKCFIGKFLKKIKRSLKRSMSSNTIFDNLGLKYVGKFNGHDLKTLIKILTDIKNSGNPTLLHVSTVKGKGLEEAEKDSAKFHGVSKEHSVSNHYFSSGVSSVLNDVIVENPDIVAITAGMKDGVGLTEFKEKHKDNVIDVGIAEEFAVTLAAGMAKNGVKPIVFIYSTFMQRSYDQIVCDVCIQNLPVIFCMDRAGLVGSDGKTHQGAFDLSYLSHIPNLTILAPKDLSELKQAILTAIELKSPVAIRYPNGSGYKFESGEQLDAKLKWEEISRGNSGAILAVGPRMLDLAIKAKRKSGIDVSIINARTIKPLDSELLLKIKDKKILTLEENAEIGGFGSNVLTFYANNGVKADVSIMGIKDAFVSHASVDRQLEINGLTIENVVSKFN